MEVKQMKLQKHLETNKIVCFLDSCLIINPKKAPGYYSFLLVITSAHYPSRFYIDPGFNYCLVSYIELLD